MCSACRELLLPIQPLLAGSISPAVRAPVHDVTDWTTPRALLNPPLSSSLGAEVYKVRGRAGRAWALQSLVGPGTGALAALLQPRCLLTSRTTPPHPTTQGHQHLAHLHQDGGQPAA